ncbi:hypothetical protein FQH03_23375 [Escherichia coli]|uniref:Uncharacterized protein n=1 Tax=Atlantibacter hermannii NBRC 105704 TaxID=1115512 RepID=H5V3W9_ATLHE|nr:hypothetical protein [Citrobacter freundii]EFN4396476.1 hypothetical protein [Escherichia coli]VDZ75678.1 Uncharacterised protein [Atlantibacter hermannii]GAB52677.1 hypothetical protein EH105704_08_00550 [Atlantibacter hermannii NBRC 105704]EFN4845207.1 hypothetical protein [Escherichia coli]EHP7652418.1 hypothetical protein [Escherichia coli]
MIQVVKNIQVRAIGSQYAVRYAAKLHIQRASRRMNIANCAVSKVTTENETDTNSQTIPKAAPFLTS